MAVRYVLDVYGRQPGILVHDELPAGFGPDRQRVGSLVEMDTDASVHWDKDRLEIVFGELESGRHELTYYIRAAEPAGAATCPTPKIWLLPGEEEEAPAAPEADPHWENDPQKHRMLEKPKRDR